MAEGKVDYRAWIIVAVMFLALGLAFTGRASLPVLMTAWENDFGWTRTLMASGGSVILIVMAVSAPVVGNLLDRHGPRFIVGAGLILSGLSISLTGMMETSGLSYFIYLCSNWVRGG